MGYTLDDDIHLWTMAQVSYALFIWGVMQY